MLLKIKTLILKQLFKREATTQLLNQQPQTNAEEKVVATNIQDTTQDKDKQPNANETTQNTTNIDKKDTDVAPTNDAPPATQ